MSLTNDKAERASPFTDEHLKRLKERLVITNEMRNIVATIPEMQALLARLEAAEAVIAIWENLDPSLQDSPIYTAWCKAAGK